MVINSAPANCACDVSRLSYMMGRTDGRTNERTVDDVMAIESNVLQYFLSYSIFLAMVLRARAELRYKEL